MFSPDVEHQNLEELGAVHTANEINGQPALWLKIYRQFCGDKVRISSYLDKVLSETDKIVLTGAGTSAFVGLSLHGMYSRNLKIHTVAVATTDIVTHPNDYFFKNETIVLVSFARSGNSPESVAAVTLADKLCKKCFHIIITCNQEGELANYRSAAPKLVILLPPEANDVSLAMTGSYSGMLLSGFLLAKQKEMDALESQINALCTYGNKILSRYAPALKEIASRNFKRAVFLGSGPFFGTATESQLKLQELTDGTIICKNDTYLGFRHGPKAVTNENTLLVFIFSNHPYVQQYERDLVQSMKKGKKPLCTIAVSEKPIEGLQFDLAIQLSDMENQLDEELLTVCDILPAQLLGYFKSLNLGLRPDAPSVSGAISRVVEGVKIYAY
jgi:tagatose-6-phosphate ketose/aldose isomerase